MGMNDTATTILAYQIDGASLGAALNANSQVTQSVTAMAAAAMATVIPFEDMAQAATSSLTQSDEMIAALNADLADTAAQAQAAIIPMEDLASAARGVGDASGGGGGFGLGGARSALRAGGMLLGGAGGQELRSVGQIATLTSVMGPLGTGAAVLAVGLKAVSDNEQAAAESAKLYVSRLQDVAKLEATGGTSADIQKHVDDLKAQKAALQETSASFAEYQRELDAIGKLSLDAVNKGAIAGQEEAQLLFQATYAELSANTGGLITDFQTFNDAVTASDAAIQALNPQIVIWTEAQKSATVAANNAAAAEKASSDQQVKDANLVIGIEQMTKQQREDKIRQDLEALAWLKKQIDSGTLYQDANDKLTAQYTDLVEEVNILSHTTNSYADQLERENAAKQLATDKNQNYLDELAKEGEIRGQITKTDADIAATRTQAAQDEAAVETKAAATRTQAAQDEADQVAKIERDAGRQLFTDKANRDAVAYIQAQQQETDALDDQQKQLDKKNAAIDKSEQAQIATIENAEAQKLDVLNQAKAQELVDLQNVQAAEVALSYNSAIGILDVHTLMWQGIESIAVTGAQHLIDAWNSLWNFSLPPVSGTAAGNAINAAVDARIHHTIFGGLSSGSGASAG